MFAINNPDLYAMVMQIFDFIENIIFSLNLEVYFIINIQSDKLSDSQRLLYSIKTTTIFNYTKNNFCSLFWKI